MPSDIEIAQKATMKPIIELAKTKLGIDAKYLEPYGHYKAKLSLDFLREIEKKPDTGRRRQDHHYRGPGRCAEPYWQEDHHLPARALPGPGLRRERGRYGRWACPGGADGRHQSALHRRLPRRWCRTQPALSDDRQP